MPQNSPECNYSNQFLISFRQACPRTPQHGFAQFLKNLPGACPHTLAWLRAIAARICAIGTQPSLNSNRFRKSFFAELMLRFLYHYLWDSLKYCPLCIDGANRKKAWQHIKISPLYSATRIVCKQLFYKSFALNFQNFNLFKLIILNVLYRII